MFLRAVLIIGALSSTLLAAEFPAASLFPNQNTENLRDLTRQALDRQIRSSLLEKDKNSKDQPLLPVLPLAQLHLKGPAQVVILSDSVCSIPLTRMKKDRTKYYAGHSIPVPESRIDPLTKAAPAPACAE